MTKKAKLLLVCELVGFGCLSAAAWVAAGMGAGLAVAGVALVAIGNVKAR
jgi:hypothetical protein